VRPGGPDHSHRSASDQRSCARFFTNDGYIHEGGVVMKGFVQDLEGLTIKNDEFRRVLYTAKILSARRHGAKAQGRDRNGSPQT